MGAIVQRLLDRIRVSTNIAVVDVPELTAITGDGDGVTLRFASGTTETAPSVIAGAAPEELFTAAGVAYEPARLRLSIAWVDADEQRVADGPRVPGRRTFSCELHHGLAADELAAAAVDGLRGLGVLREDADARVLHAGIVPAFTAPSFEERERFDEARAAFDALELPVELVGGAAAFLADSFNEQVVQGLRAAAVSG
jgi:hypothetical protein